MSCEDIAGGGTVCKTIQVLEPDPSLPVQSWRIDPTLDEQGENILNSGQTSLNVNFTIPKASANYRFEYLYVDALGLVKPGDVEPIVTGQTQYGFTVDFAGAPLGAGYILRWRVIVLATEIAPGTLDTPQSFYLQLPQGGATYLVTFANPRSSTVYGFSELRIENLVDPAASQSPIALQVTGRTVLNFTVALSPSPPSNNYFLVARSP